MVRDVAQVVQSLDVGHEACVEEDVVGMQLCYGQRACYLFDVDLDLSLAECSDGLGALCRLPDVAAADRQHGGLALLGFARDPACRVAGHDKAVSFRRSHSRYALQVARHIIGRDLLLGQLDALQVLPDAALACGVVAQLADVGFGGRTLS